MRLFDQCIPGCSSEKRGWAIIALRNKGINVCLYIRKMVHNVPEPSTPPRQLREDAMPATPATPRFGTFEDMPNFPQKQRLFQGQTEHTPRRSDRRPSQIATPRQTPRKRLPLITPSKGTRRVKRATGYRSAKTPPAPESSAAHPSIGENEGNHPHSADPKGPGMWFVFRGKRIFRPLPPGEKPVKPVRLFPQAPQGKCLESEEETDHEL